MKTNYLQTCVIIMIAFVSLKITAQEEELGGHGSHFRISPVLSHTYIPTATAEGTKTIIIPSVGLDIEYWFNHKFGIGLHNDLELLNYEIEHMNHELTIEREYPVVVTLDGLATIYKHFVLVFGAGVEFEKSKNLFIVRTGLEYEVPFAKHWDLAPTILYDYRKNAFGTWSVGIGIGRRF